MVGKFGHMAKLILMLNQQYRILSFESSTILKSIMEQYNYGIDISNHSRPHRLLRSEETESNNKTKQLSSNTFLYLLYV